VAELGDKADFLLDFVPVGIIGPEEDIEGDSKGLPHELDGTIFGISEVLYCRQADVEESDGR
jgi:hypothetical protein